MVNKAKIKILKLFNKSRKILNNKNKCLKLYKWKLQLMKQKYCTIFSTKRIKQKFRSAINTHKMNKTQNLINKLSRSKCNKEENKFQNKNQEILMIGQMLKLQKQLKSLGNLILNLTKYKEVENSKIKGRCLEMRATLQFQN